MFPPGSNNMLPQQTQSEQQPTIIDGAAVYATLQRQAYDYFPPEPSALMLEIVEHNQRIQQEHPGCAGPEYTLVCENCKKLFKAEYKLSGQQRTSFEYETLRRVLLIQDHNVLPVFCDDCYEQATVRPESRCGYPNLVLEKLGVQPPRD